MRKNLWLLLIVLIANTIKAQSLFPEEFDGCNTTHFIIEKDTATVHANIVDMTKIFKNGLNNKVQKQIKGIIKLQILVDTEGNSCLLSLKNETNIQTEKLNLKEIIDSKLVWNKPESMMSVILYISFKSGMMGFARLGLDEKGFHKLLQEL